ncbi:RnfH family protein [Gammaproteobacteria bacterium 45_16_T64]|nr:RnfH family protein [Gammaproteobacteria bacterium 45_16_T64]
MAEEKITVEVAYALPDRQELVTLQVDEGTSMFDAAMQSRIADKFPELELEGTPMGIFGKTERKPKDRILEAGERVEIYRPLIADPKEVRKRRAAEAKAKRENS